MMDDYVTMTDSEGVEIKIGDRVVYGDVGPGEEPQEAVITEITDIDGDYDDELGRGVMIPPYVKLRFPDDGTEESVRTYSTTAMTWADYPDGPREMTFASDDLVKVKP